MLTNILLPQPTKFSDYTWRAAQPADAEAIFELALIIDEADNRNRAGTLEEKRREFDDPDLRVESDTVMAFDDADRLVALGWVYTPEPVHKQWAYLWGEVHPEHRDHGLGTFLMRWMEARAQQIIEKRNDHRPKVMRVGCQQSDTDRQQLFSAFGFKPVRYWYEMRRDLKQPIPATVLPDGVEISPWSQALDAGFYAAFNDAFSDHWEFEVVTQAIWDLYFTGSDSFLAEQSYAVMADEEIVAFSVNYLSPEENERTGLPQAWIGDLGTRELWRKKGLASALIAHSMQAFSDLGMTYASLGVDTENTNGALRIYKRLGFEPVRTTMTWVKEVG